MMRSPMIMMMMMRSPMMMIRKSLMMIPPIGVRILSHEM